MGAGTPLVPIRHQPDQRGATGPDDDLVARVRAGDDAAFETIYDRYAQGVLAFCVHMLGDREWGEDALQLTFVSAYRALRRGDTDVALRPWLYTIARNRCLSELRARRESVHIDGVVVDHLRIAGPADLVQRREQLRELVEDIQRLPNDQRAALVLFELGDHSHTEIATVLGVRREKVKALIFQAREALLRGRQARDSPCAEIRERVANVRGRVLPRSTTRAHIDRCAGCAAFEDEVRAQRRALALVLPVAAAADLKATVLSSAVAHSGAAAATATGAAGSGMAPAGGGSGAAVAGGGTSASVAGSGTGIGAGAAAGGGAGGGAVTASTAAAGSVATTGAGAASIGAAAGAPATAIVSGVNVGAGCAAAGAIAGPGSSAVVAKIVTAAAIAVGVVGASHPVSRDPGGPSSPIPTAPAAVQIATGAAPSRATVRKASAAALGITAAVPPGSAATSIEPASTSAPGESARSGTSKRTAIVIPAAAGAATALPATPPAGASASDATAGHGGSSGAGEGTSSGSGNSGASAGAGSSSGVSHCSDPNSRSDSTEASGSSASSGSGGSANAGAGGADSTTVSGTTAGSGSVGSETGTGSGAAGSGTTGSQATGTASGIAGASAAAVSLDTRAGTADARRAATADSTGWGTAHARGASTADASAGSTASASTGNTADSARESTAEATSGESARRVEARIDGASGESTNPTGSNATDRAGGGDSTARSLDRGSAPFRLRHARMQAAPVRMDHVSRLSGPAGAVDDVHRCARR